MNCASELDRLSALIPRERDALLYQWREQVRELPSAQHLAAPTLNDHVQTNGLTLQGEPLHILNRVLDGAIGLAVLLEGARLCDLIDRSLPTKP